jgi:hypothetical protein
MSRTLVRQVSEIIGAAKLGIRLKRRSTYYASSLSRAEPLHLIRFERVR